MYLATNVDWLQPIDSQALLSTFLRRLWHLDFSRLDIFNLMTLTQFSHEIMVSYREKYQAYGRTYHSRIGKARGMSLQRPNWWETYLHNCQCATLPSHSIGDTSENSIKSL